MTGKPFELVEIAQEVSRAGFKLVFENPVIERQYIEDRRQSARRLHWATVFLLMVIFDAFIISECKTAPEIVPISAWLRFAIFTPAAVAYVLLDWRGCPGRLSNVLLSLIVVAPTLISAIESRYATSAAIVAGFQTTPLLLLAVLNCRMGVIQAAITNGLACAIYFAAVLATSLIPATLIPSMLLTDVAIALTTVFFTLQIDLRNRKVYLLAQQADLGREMLAAQNRKLAKLTQVDALTNLGNRRCFDETLAALWRDERLAHMQVTLIMFDIDCFKLFNDTYGHQAGDECLTTLASTVLRCLREDRCTLVRYGGEEFAVILPATSQQQGCHVAERVRRSVCECAIPHPDAGPTPYVTISLGVATVAPFTQGAGKLIEAADNCLYEAKRSGRNRVVAQRSPALPEAPSARADSPGAQAPAGETMLVSHLGSVAPRV